MNWIVLLIVVAAIAALRFVKGVNILGWLAAWWVGLFVFLSYGIEPPIPSSIVGMFMGIITLALLAYLTVSTDYMKTARNAIEAFVTEPRFKLPLMITLIAVPLLVSYKVYSDMNKAPVAPFPSRTIHPQPPLTITFKGQTFDLSTAVNPYRDLERSDPQAFKMHLENGRRVYTQNCIYCHGDNMAGQGIFASGFNPLPANFQDPGTIAQLQENYMFWRIAKGAPDLPEESTPWLSAMPAWEKFLTADEIWDVILYLYDFTGHKPRADEDH